MGTLNIVNIIAILLSPLVAVLVTRWLQKRKERRQDQLTVLASLIATRCEPLSPEAVRSLNVIDLFFHDKPAVRKLWREYYEMLSNEGLNNPSGYQQRTKKNIELITAMANALGYGKAITHLDVDRVYSPVGMWTQMARNEEIQNEWLRVLKATARLQVELLPQNPPGGNAVER